MKWIILETIAGVFVGTRKGSGRGGVTVKPQGIFGVGRGILENFRGRGAPGQPFPPGSGLGGAGCASLLGMQPYYILYEHCISKVIAGKLFPKKVHLNDATCLISFPRQEPSPVHLLAIDMVKNGSQGTRAARLRAKKSLSHFWSEEEKIGRREE